MLPGVRSQPREQRGPGQPLHSLAGADGGEAGHDVQHRGDQAEGRGGGVAEPVRHAQQGGDDLGQLGRVEYRTGYIECTVLAVK